MKIRLLCLVLLSTIIFAGCKKGNGPDGGFFDTHKGVKIGGAIYETDTIGTQIWTTTNYNGNGGLPAIPNDSIPNPDTDYDATEYGKYYTPQQAYAIKLPKGWHLPTTADFNKLLSNYTQEKDSVGNYYGADVAWFNIASYTGWDPVEGNRRSEFKAKPAGYVTKNLIIANAPYIYTASWHRLADMSKWGVFLSSDVVVNGNGTTTYNTFFVDGNYSLFNPPKSARIYAFNVDTQKLQVYFTLRFVRDL